MQAANYTRDDAVRELSDTFHVRLVLALGPGPFLTLRERNARCPDSGICASHDFCDANLIMQDAFVAVVGREADLNSPIDRQLWADAWARFRNG